MSTLNDLHRAARIKALASNLVSAAETEDKARRINEQIEEVEPDNVALSSGQVMIDLARATVTWCIERLDEEGAFDDIVSLEGKVIRAYLLCGQRHPDHQSAFDALLGMLGTSG